MDSREPLMLIEAYQSIYQPQEDDLFEEVVDYLLDEGYVDDVDSALALIEELSDEEIEGILEVRGGGLIKGSSPTYAGEWGPHGLDDNRSDAQKRAANALSNARGAAARRGGTVTRDDLAKGRTEAGIRSQPSVYDRQQAPRRNPMTNYGGEPGSGISPHGTQSGLAMTPKARAEGRAKSLEAKGGKYTRQANTLRGKIESNKNLNASYDYDAYDVVLEHLISEGYVDSEDAALQMMSHMSEEWVEGILDEALSSNRGKKAINKFQDQNERPNWYRKPGESKNPGPDYTLVAATRHKEGSPNPHNSATPEDYRDIGNRPTRRGGRGVKGGPKTGYYGTDRRDSDRGRGNAARRRASGR